jgi:DNA-binding beta-propeller fold protein YncE
LAVAGSFDNVISLIDTASWSLLATVPAGDFPTMVSFSDDDTRLYVSNRNIGKVRVFDNTGAVPVLDRIISVGASPWQVVDDAQGRIWVNNWGDKRVSAYDIASGALVGSVLFASSPVGLAYDAASDTVRVAHGELGLSVGGEAGYTESQSGTLSVIDAATFSRTDYDLGVGPSAMAMSSDGNVLAVAAPIGDGVAILSFMSGCSSADLSEPFGVLNFFDVSVFVSAFSAQDSIADFTGEGIFDFFDVSAFLQAFAVGCP